MPSKLSLSPLSPPSPTLAHLNRLLSSTSGQDKVFMLVAYGSHVVNYALRHPKLRTKARLELAERIGKLGALVGDARVLYRLLGLFPIIQWCQSLNDPASAPKDWRLKLVQRLQCAAMLCYYPMEHYYYLAGKGIFTASPKKIGLVAIWSCRFWAAYVVLQIVHNRLEASNLAQSHLALSASRSAKLRAADSEKATPITQEDIDVEKKEMARLSVKGRSLANDAWVQAGYLPLTMHWSLPNGLLPDQVYVGLCGSVAAVFGLRGVWRATA